MKAESIKHLVDVSQKVAELYGQALMSNDADKKADYEFILNHITTVMRLETPQSNTKFNLWNYVAKDESRPQMCCIFHQDGYKVATDSRVLIALKEDYPENYEGKLLKKCGTFEETYTKYPNWKSVIPTDYPNEVEVDIKAFREGYKNFKAAKKMGAILSNAKGYVRINVGEKEDGLVLNNYFEIEHFKLLADVMTEWNVNKIKFADVINRAALVEYGESKAILMPNRFNEEDLEIIEPARIINL